MVLLLKQEGEGGGMEVEEGGAEEGLEEGEEQQEPQPQQDEGEGGYLAWGWALTVLLPNQKSAQCLRTSAYGLQPGWPDLRLSPAGQALQILCYLCYGRSDGQTLCTTQKTFAWRLFHCSEMYEEHFGEEGELEADERQQAAEEQPQPTDEVEAEPAVAAEELADTAQGAEEEQQGGPQVLVPTPFGGDWGCRACTWASMCLTRPLPSFKQGAT